MFISNIGKAKLMVTNKPKESGEPITTAQTGRDFLLEIDGKVVPGVMSKTIDLAPNEIATLTIVMKLPEIIYVDE